jgi:hypothetical protein
MGMAKGKGDDLAPVYEWVGAVPLSRKRTKFFARDFSDGCLTAEVIKHYAAGKFAVDLHNYSEALSGARKRDNWSIVIMLGLDKRLLGQQGPTMCVFSQ